MKFKKASLIAITIGVAALAGCSSISVSEKTASKRMNETINKHWSGAITNTFDNATSPYRIDIENITIDFRELQSYYDSNITITGRFSIDNNPYSANSDIKIELSANTFIDSASSTLEIQEPYVKNIDLPNLYRAYSDDIMKSLYDSLNQTSGIYLKNKPILSFKEESKKLSLHVGEYEMVKKVDGKKIYIEYKK